MSERLGPEDVERVAALAHLALTGEERERFTPQLAQILAYAEQIRVVDTTGVPPTSHVLTRYPAFRADEARPALPREEALANAPETDLAAGLFKVPRVLAE